MGDRVEEYVYLGQTISVREGMEREMNVRRQKVWRKYWSLRRVFKGKMSVKSKVKILESCVIPVLCYGAETWALTKSQVSSLQKTQRAMERSLLGIKLRERKSNEEMRKVTETVDVGYKIKKQKFKYAGHIIRGSNERWTKKVTEWLPYGKKRARGRPKTRWEDEIRYRVEL